jgi:hypothetical protein
VIGLAKPSKESGGERMSDIDRRAKMASMRRKQRHMAEERSMEFRTLQTENSRLRAALEEIVQMLGPESFAGEPEALVAERAAALSIARQALEGGQP